MSKQITDKPDYSSYSRPELIERVEALYGESERYKSRLKGLFYYFLNAKGLI